MKLRLPIQLFSVLIALANVSTTLASTPTGYGEVMVNTMDDFTLNLKQSTAYTANTDIAWNGVTGAIVTDNNPSTNDEYKYTKWYISSVTDAESSPLYDFKLINSHYTVDTEDHIYSEGLIFAQRFEVANMKNVEIAGNESTIKSPVSSVANAALISTTSNIDRDENNQFVDPEHGTYFTANSAINISNNTYKSHSGSSIATVEGGVFGGTTYFAGNGDISHKQNTVMAESNAFSDAAADAWYQSLSERNDLYKQGQEAFEAEYGVGSYAQWAYLWEMVESGKYTYEQALGPGNMSATAIGGVIHGLGVTYQNNGNISFEANGVTACGETDVFKAQGGAISTIGSSSSQGYGVTLNSNGNVEFKGNYAVTAPVDKDIVKDAVAQGGAIYVKKGKLHIQNNDNVLFEKNYVTDGETYRLQSIYAEDNERSSSTGALDVQLSAAKDKVIEFRDSIYVDVDMEPKYNANTGVTTSSSFDINANYTDANGHTIEQTGTIIFTGKYTEEHLNEILAARGENRVATQEEILASRTSEIKGKVTVHAGTLSLQDGVIFKADELVIASGARLEVDLTSNVESHVSFSLTDAATATVAATLDTDLVLESGAVFTIMDGVVDLAGHDLTIFDGAEIVTNLTDLSNDTPVTLFTNVGEYVNTNFTVILNGQEAIVSYNENGGTVSVAPIPEPTTATLSLLALGCLLARRRR